MKKIFILVLSFLMLPSVILAEETINNGDVVTPIGAISVYAGLESDTQLLERGYLIANGASLLRTDYPELFAIIKDTYGASDSEHFNLPDLRGRTVVGMKSDDSDFNSLGKKGGEKTVTLTTAQIPAHTHTFTGTSSTTSTESNSHTHTFNGTTSNKELKGSLLALTNSSSVTGIISASGSMQFAALSSGTNWGAVTYTITASHTHTYSGTTSAASTTHTHTVTATGTNANAGGSKAHNNMQPYIALKYIIKVK